MTHKTRRLAARTIRTLDDVAGICEATDLPNAAKALRLLAAEWREWQALRTMLPPDELTPNPGPAPEGTK